jgi:maleylacetate reductase
MPARQRTPATLQPGVLEFPPTQRVYWGAGSVDQLPAVLRSFGASRALVLTTQSLTRNESLSRRVESACGSMYVGRVDKLPAHTPVDAVHAASRQARDFGADALVSFGGGSVNDATKAVAGRLIDAGHRLVHIAIPTTLSGAEYADHFGVTDTTNGVATKRTFIRRDVTAVAVILDPELAVATPSPLWAGTAVKALDHAIEGLLCSTATRPVLDELAQVGIRGLAANLGRSLDPANLARRQLCQIAAWQCYFAPASLTLGLSHRIGHVLGGTYGVPHGITSAMTLPAVMRAMADAAPGQLATVARALDPSVPLDVNSPSSADPADAAHLLSELIATVGLTASLRDFGIEHDDAAAIARTVADMYPHALGQLGEQGESRLLGLLHEIW